MDHARTGLSSRNQAPRQPTHSQPSQKKTTGQRAGGKWLPSTTESRSPLFISLSKLDSSTDASPAAVLSRQQLTLDCCATLHRDGDAFANVDSLAG